MSNPPATPAAPGSPLNRPTSVEDDDRHLKLLGEGVPLLQAKRPEEAIKRVFDPVIAFYESHWRNSEIEPYCTRWQVESLLYLMMAATAKPPKSAIVLKLAWSDAHYLRAYALIEMGKFPEAAQALAKALELAPQNAHYLNELGNLQSRVKPWDKALQTFKTASEAANSCSPPGLKNAELGRSWRGLGYAYVELKRFGEAKAIYRECLKLNPADRQAAAELKFVEGIGV